VVLRECCRAAALGRWWDCFRALREKSQNLLTDTLLEVYFVFFSVIKSVNGNYFIEAWICQNNGQLTTISRQRFRVIVPQHPTTDMTMLMAPASVTSTVDTYGNDEPMTSVTKLALSTEK
jgi:hypothetical protein